MDSDSTEYWIVKFYQNPYTQNYFMSWHEVSCIADWISCGKLFGAMCIDWYSTEELSAGIRWQDWVAALRYEDCWPWDSAWSSPLQWRLFYDSSCFHVISCSVHAFFRWILSNCNRSSIMICAAISLLCQVELNLCNASVWFAIIVFKALGLFNGAVSS